MSDKEPSEAAKAFRDDLYFEVSGLSSRVHMLDVAYRLFDQHVAKLVEENARLTAVLASIELAARPFDFEDIKTAFVQHELQLKHVHTLADAVLQRRIGVFDLRITCREDGV